MREQRPMWTNGCVMTYGRHGEGTCPIHGRMDREATVYHLRADPKVRVTTFRGAMRKHGTDRHMQLDRDIAKVQALSEVKSYVWPVLRRRGNTLSVASK